MNGIFRDLLYAARIYRRSAAFTVITVILLAHGIAVNTTIFSVIDAVFLRTLPVDRPERLVRFVQTIPGGPGSDQYRYPFYAMLREHKEVFSGVLAIVERNLALRDGPAAERVRVEFVNAEFFFILGVGPSLGRVIGPEDEVDAAAVPVVLSHTFWKRRYQSDRGVIGRKIWIQGRDAVIVGVTPRGFNGLSVETSPDIRLLLKQVLTLTSDSEQKRLEDTYPNMMVRLQPGIDFQQAKAEFDRLWNLYLNSGLSPETKQWESRQKIELQSAARGVSRLRNQFSTALTFLMIAAILLQLIVCANVAGLLLARSAARNRRSPSASPSELPAPR